VLGFLTFLGLTALLVTAALVYFGIAHA
jgi:hypothetical protein